MTERFEFRAVAGVLAAALVMLAVMPRDAAAQAAATGGGQVAMDRERGQSIEDLVAMALRQAPDGLAARARADAARGDLDQAGRRPNPSLSIERRDEVGGMDTQTAVGLTWPLDLFRRSGRLAVGRAGTDAADAAAAERDRQIAAETRLRAARLVAGLRVLGILEETAASTRKTAELIAARAEAGGAPPIDRDVATVEAARADVAVRRQRGEVDALASSLRAVIGLAPDVALLLRDTLEDAAAHSEALVQQRLSAGRVEEAIAGRPDLRLADAEIARAAAREDLARREGRTDVSVFASYMRMTSGFPQLGLTAAGQPEPIEGTFHNVAVGAMVMLPWRNRNQGAVAAAAADGNAARHEREARRLEAVNEIDALRRREAAARDAVAIFDAGMRGLAAKNVDVLRESYQLGRATLLDVLTETRRFLEVEMAHATGLLELVEARVTLAAALGGAR